MTPPRRPIHALLTAAFATTLLLSAALLFSVQPMLGRMVLPALGGAPSVWTTCMLYFQSMLLLGYLLAHVITTRLPFGLQLVAIFGLIAAAFAFLPVEMKPSAAETLALAPSPPTALLLWLLRTSGIPVLAVCVTSPLLQRWFSYSDHPAASDPYPLSVASNLGSLGTLLAYPFVFERYLPLKDQARMWGQALAVFAVLLGLVSLATAAARRGPTDAPPVRVCSLRDILIWIALTLVPSSLLLGLTAHITSDLAPIPLLWVVPLALYLLSFVIAFSRGADLVDRWAARVFPLTLMLLCVVMGVGLVQPYWVPLHLLAFFCAAVLCHVELARRRPPPESLTLFYLAMSAGGMFGGLLNAVLAPLLFDRLAEYPLALFAAALIVSLRGKSEPLLALLSKEIRLPVAIGAAASLCCWNPGGFIDSPAGVLTLMLASGLALLVVVRHRRRPLAFALTFGALLMASGLSTGVGGRVLERDRGFFGVVSVTDVPERRRHRLFHGSTVHGEQSTDPDHRREPLAYHSREGPVGDIFRAFDAEERHEPTRIAIIGMGAGAMACYARPGQSWTFYEIDPAVVRLAREPRYFSYLADSRADACEVVTGDGRIELSRAPDGWFDMIVFDAFSSHAIPMHLMTRESLALARRKLRPDGALVFNITNRYIDLSAVLAALAADAGMQPRVRIDALNPLEEARSERLGSIWALLVDRPERLKTLANDPRWMIPAAREGTRIWTDDHASFLDHLRWRLRAPVSP